jgi:hypothetical protein
MPHTFGPLDRLRVERLVWLLDQQLYDLPRPSRVAIRREVRDNLREAAADVGTTEALRRVGGSRELAQRYLTAEFGDGPRHSWIGALYAFTAVPMVLVFFLDSAARGFRDGITALDPQATGAYLWQGVSYLQHPATITFSNGQADGLGGGWTPLTYAIWLLATVAAGRLWRLPRVRRRRAAAVTPV